jgi:hypothetical protein
MFALGQKRTLKRLHLMSALPPKADIAERDRHVRFVPKADIPRCRKRRYSITSSARLTAMLAVGNSGSLPMLAAIRRASPRVS